jgi:hypothetical protein
MKVENLTLIAGQLLAINDAAFEQIKTYVDHGGAKSLSDAKAYVDQVIGSAQSVQDIVNSLQSFKDAFDTNPDNPGLELVTKLVNAVDDYLPRIEALELAGELHENRVNALQATITTNKQAADEALTAETQARQAAYTAIAGRVTAVEEKITVIQLESEQYVTGEELVALATDIRDMVVAKFALPVPA